MIPWTQDKREVLRWYHEYKSKQRCERCGSTYKLQFHHCDPECKRFNVSNMVMRGLSVARIKEEMRKCEILCERCHKAAHREGKE